MGDHLRPRDDGASPDGETIARGGRLDLEEIVDGNGAFSVHTGQMNDGTDSQCNRRPIAGRLGLRERSSDRRPVPDQG
ncbi:MAG: hypothetical protein E6833_38215, partial [Bradyrhizobium sp.]|nr:hypothetical protein [Bradyrhizobium sp.]